MCAVKSLNINTGVYSTLYTVDRTVGGTVSPQLDEMNSADVSPIDYKAYGLGMRTLFDTSHERACVWQ